MKRATAVASVVCALAGTVAAEPAPATCTEHAPYFEPFVYGAKGIKGGSIAVRTSVGYSHTDCATDGMQVRGGLFMENAERGHTINSGELALGGELEMTWPLPEAWRVGPHVVIGIGQNGSRSGVKLFAIGPRFRYKAISLGFDFLHETAASPPHPTSTVNQLAVGFGVSTASAKPILLTAGSLGVLTVLGFLLVCGTGDKCFE